MPFKAYPSFFCDTLTLTDCFAFLLQEILCLVCVFL